MRRVLKFDFVRVDYFDADDSPKAERDGMPFLSNNRRDGSCNRPSRVSTLLRSITGHPLGYIRPSCVYLKPGRNSASTSKRRFVSSLISAGQHTAAVSGS